MTAESRPKRRWLRWVFGGLCALGLLLLGVHALMVHQARRMLSAQLQSYQAAGEPVWPADFNSSPPPDEHNAALDLIAAAASIDPNSDLWTQFDWLRYDLPLTPEERDLIRAVVAAHSVALNLLEQAAAKPAVHWPVQISSPVHRILHLDLPPQRLLARLATAAAVEAHERGDHDTALRRIEQVLFQCGAMKQYPELMGYMVAVAMEMAALDRLQKVTPALRIGSGPAAAPPRQVRRLIGQLLDEEAIHTNLRRALLFTRMEELDLGLALAEGKIGFGSRLRAGPPSTSESLLQGLGRPLLINDTRLVIEYTTDFMNAASAKNHPAFLAAYPPNPREQPDFRQWAHPISAILLPNLTRMMEWHYRHLAERRMAAIALAIRLYAADHEGQLPRRLEDLVPTYLPAVPLDPLTLDQPIRYRADPEPILYSVGVNGIDDGGSSARSGPMSGNMNRWELRDAIVPLTLPPRRQASDEQ